MTIARFEVNIPNPTTSVVEVELVIEAGGSDELANLGFPKVDQRLEVAWSGISLDPCDDRGTERLSLKLEPRSSVTAFVVAETIGGPGAAVLHMVDRRDGQVAGGVMLVCATGIDIDPAGALIEPETACPAVLGNKPYPLVGDDPRTRPSSASLKVGVRTTIVVPILNPTSEPLPDAWAYLEHLGLGDGSFDAGTWQIGTLGPGETFYATWEVEAASAQPADLEPCVVVGAVEFDPVRLRGPIAVHHRREKAPPRRTDAVSDQAPRRARSVVSLAD
jgi:hypothetical protein